MQVPQIREAWLGCECVWVLHRGVEQKPNSPETSTETLPPKWWPTASMTGLRWQPIPTLMQPAVQLDAACRTERECRRRSLQCCSKGSA
eukprot:scaffold140030_cov16-Tisochrysis_lutea.AAC.1